MALSRTEGKILAVIAAVLVAAYLAVGFTTVYIDPDPVIYTMVGDGIFKYGKLPYDYVFDHKPVATYYFYGALNWLYPFRYGMYTFLAIVGAIVTTAATCRIFGLGRRGVWFFLTYVLLGANYSYSSGNTEVIVNALAASSLLFLIRSKAAGLGSAILGGLFAAITINVNYLGGILLSLPTLYVLFTGTSRPMRAVAYALGVAGGLGLIFLPYFITGASVVDYLALQRAFGAAYSPTLNERAVKLLESSFAVAYLVPLLVAYLLHREPAKTIESGAVPRAVTPAIKPAIPLATGADAYGIVLAWAASAALASLISGHGFSHYLILILPPLTVMVVTILFGDHASRPVKLMVAVPLLIYSAVSCAWWINASYSTGRQIDAAGAGYQKIREITKGERVLNIDASHALLFLGDANSQDKFVFFTHAAMIFKEEEEAHFLAILDRQPGYVLTSYRMCDGGARFRTLCGRLAATFQPVADYASSKYPDLGFTLYGRR